MVVREGKSPCYPWIFMLALSMSLLAGGCTDVEKSRPILEEGAKKPFAEVRKVADYAKSLGLHSSKPTAYDITSQSSTSWGSYLAGYAALRNYDLDVAEFYLNHALIQNRHSQSLLKLTFIAALSRGHHELVRSLAQQLLVSTTEEDISLLARIVLASDRLLEGDNEAALAQLSPINPKEIDLAPRLIYSLTRSWILVALGRGEEALESIAWLNSSDRGQLLYNLHAAMIYDVIGKPHEAEPHYLTALNYQEIPAARIVKLVGNFFERNGDKERARDVYQRSVEKREGDSEIVFLLRQLSNDHQLPSPMVETALQGLAQAFVDLASISSEPNNVFFVRLAVKLAPQFWGSYMMLGNIAERQGQNSEAIALYRQIPQNVPLFWRAQLRIAMNLDVLDHTDEARTMLEAMAEKEPQRYDALIQLGNIFDQREHFDEAARIYDRAIDRIEVLREKDWRLLYRRGIAWERSKVWERAEEDFLQALKLRPDQPSVLNYLGYSWLEQGRNLQQAYDMILKALSQKPNEGAIVDSLGWALYHLGRYEEAVEQLERAANLLPLDPVIIDHLGDAYWQVGRRTEARYKWKRSLDMDPEPDLEEAVYEKLRHGLPYSEALQQ